MENKEITEEQQKSIIQEKFDDIKGSLKGFKSFEKYGLNVDELKIDDIILSEELGNVAEIRFSYKGKIIDYDYKISLFEESMTFDFGAAMVDALRGKAKRLGTELKDEDGCTIIENFRNGYIDVLEDEADNILWSSNKGVTSNENGIGDMKHQIDYLGFAFLSNEPQRVARDCNDDEVCELIRSIMSARIYIETENYLDEFEISEKELSYMVDEVNYFNRIAQFWDDDEIRQRMDKFLKEQGLQDKLAVLVTFDDSSEDLYFYIAPQIPKDHTKEYFEVETRDGYSFKLVEIPEITQKELNKVVKFLDSLKQELKDEMNSELQNMLICDYKQRDEYLEKINELNKKENTQTTTRKPKCN